MQSLAQATANYFLKKGAIKEEDLEIHVYGWEGIFSNVATYLAILAVGLIFSRFWESVVWLGGFMLMRVYAGGYHATSHGRCLLTSCLIWLATLLLIPHISVWTAAAMLAFAVIVVWICAPAEHPNNPHSAGHQHKLKWVARVLVIVLSGVCAGVWTMWPVFGRTLTLAVFGCCVSTLVAKIVYRKALAMGANEE